jgi:hypothetical protein
MCLPPQEVAPCAHTGSPHSHDSTHRHQTLRAPPCTAHHRARRGGPANELTEVHDDDAPAGPEAPPARWQPPL